MTLKAGAPLNCAKMEIMTDTNTISQTCKKLLWWQFFFLSFFLRVSLKNSTSVTKSGETEASGDNQDLILLQISEILC